jgi:uncharacterized membrane protein
MDTRGAVEFVGLAVDLAGVGVIVIAMVVAGVGFARGLIRDGPFDSAYRQLRQAIGRGILLGLELLVAGDIIRTVAIAPTFSSVGVLAVIVVIRTFLSFPRGWVDGQLGVAAEIGCGRGHIASG